MTILFIIIGIFAIICLRKQWIDQNEINKDKEANKHSWINGGKGAAIMHCSENDISIPPIKHYCDTPLGLARQAYMSAKALYDERMAVRAHIYPNAKPNEYLPDATEILNLTKARQLLESLGGTP